MEKLQLNVYRNGVRKINEIVVPFRYFFFIRLNYNDNLVLKRTLLGHLQS